MLGNPSAPQESLLQQFENIAALFPDGVDETSYSNETPRAFQRADAPGDLLQKPYHAYPNESERYPKRPLRKIVREGHFRLLDEQKRSASRSYLSSRS